MVLHIAIEGIDGVGKTTQTQKLSEFLTKKNYNVKVCKQPANANVIEILETEELLNHEIALLMAFDRSLTYYNNDFEQYDLVIWDRSILSSYAYNTDDNTPNLFIKQINRYFPLMDLYIIIRTNEYMQSQDYTNKYDLIPKYEKLEKHKNIAIVDYEEGIEKVHQEIVKTIFEFLPKCNWCGRFFTPNKHNKKYCNRIIDGKTCSEWALEEQYRINNRNYYHRYKDVMSEKQKGGLGSKNANLHGTADPNPLAELEKVRRAKRSLGLKPIQ